MLSNLCLSSKSFIIIIISFSQFNLRQCHNEEFITGKCYEMLLNVELLRKPQSYANIRMDTIIIFKGIFFCFHYYKKCIIGIHLHERHLLLLFTVLYPNFLCKSMRTNIYSGPMHMCQYCSLIVVQYLKIDMYAANIRCMD